MREKINWEVILDLKHCVEIYSLAIVKGCWLKHLSLRLLTFFKVAHLLLN